MAERIPFKGTFDTSDIISSINRMYAEIKKNNKTPLIDGLEKDIKAIERLQEKISAQKAKGFANQKEFKEYESNLNKLDTAIIKMGQSFEKVNAKNLDIELKQIKDRITELKTETDKLGKNFETSLSKSFTTKLSTDLKTLAKEINEVAKTGADFNVAKAQVKSYYDELIKGAERANLTKAQLKAKDLGQAWMPKVGLQAGSFNLNGANFSDVVSKFNRIAQDSTITDKMKAFVEDLKDINVEIKNNATSYDTVKNKFGAFSSALATYTETEINNRNKVNDLIAERDKNIETLEKNAAAYNGIAQKGIQIQNEEANAAQKITAEHQALDSGIKDLTGDLKRYMDVEKQNAALTSVAVEAQDKLNTSLDNLKSRIGYIFSLGNAYYQLRNILKQTLNDVNDIDKAFASIAMVTEKTVNGLWQHYSEYAQLAQKLGQSTESAIKTSALFYQQGLKDAEVMRLTEDTMKLATLAGLDFEKATSQMTAALRGFHMEMEESSHVTDVYSELAAHAAADVNGIAYAMSKTASIANNAGMSFENTAAFLTQMIETTQEAPENIGTAMKTIIARFTELKENVAGTADSEFEDLDYNKVDKALKTVGVSLKDVNGQFRNLDDVFLELSSKWDTLDRNSQRYIATIAAGSRQQSRFIAMMEDYERTMELVTVTENAKSRADEQFAKNAESLQFKLQSLKTAWEQLRLSFANSDFFKNIVDGMTKLVNLLGKMDKGQIAVVATIGIVMGKTIINSLIDTIKKGGTQITEALQESTQQPFMQRGKGAFTKSFSGDTLYRNGITKNLESVLGPTSKQNSAFGINTLVSQIAEVDQVGSQLDITSEKLEHIKTVTAEILAEKAAGSEVDEGYLGLLGEQGLHLQKQKAVLEDSLKSKIQEVNKTKERLGYEKEITLERARQLNQDNKKVARETPYAGTPMGSFKNSEAGKMLANGAQTALMTGVTTAITTAISGADFETVVKTTLTTSLMAIIPSVISAIGPSIIAALTGPAGIVVIAVAAIVAGIATIIKKSKEAATAEMERLNNVAAANKKLKEDMDEIIADHKKTEAELEKIKKYYEDIKKYSNKSLRTTEEEKRLTEAQDYIRNNYEEAYREYDGHFEVIESKMDTIIEKMDNSGSAGQLYAKYSKQQENLSDRYEFLNTLSGYYNGSSMTEQLDTSFKLVFSNLSKDFFKDGAQGIWDLINGRGDTLTDKIVLDELQKLYGDAIPQEYLDMFEDGDVDRKRIVSLMEELTKIEKKQKEDTTRQGVEAALKLDEWDDRAAKIASYMKGAEIKPETKFADRISDNLVENISQGKWSEFGADADTIKKALASLGYDDPQELFDSGSNLKKWEDLTDEMRNALGGQGITPETWNKGNLLNTISNIGALSSWGTNKIPIWLAETITGKDLSRRAQRKEGSVENAILSRIIAVQALQTSDLFSKEYKELFEENREVFEDYATAELNYAGLTYDEYKKNLNSIIENTSEEVKQAINDYDAEDANSIKNQWEQASNNLIDANISENIVDGFAFEASKRFNDILTDASAATKDMVVKYLNSQSLSSQDWNVLGLVDLSSIGLDGAQKYIDQLVKAGHTAEEAQKIFNDYVTAMSQATFSGRYLGSESTGILHEEVKTKISELPKQFETITKAQEEMLDKGYISQKTYLQLCKDGFEDYITTTSRGYELIGDKTQEFFVKQAMSAKNYIDQQIVNQQAYMDQAQKYLNDRHFQSRLDEVYTQETLEQQQALIDRYRAFYGEEFGNMLQAVYSSGAKTVRSYYDELSSGLQALRNELGGAYYDALVAINEQYKTASDKVEELNKELEKLNDELEENNRNVDEAWQKYQEALHGPEFFKSSLDPLINFNNQLSNVNDNLDELKDSLKDVDNVTNSVDILNNLGSEYDSKAATLQSENVVYNNALANLRNSLLSEYGQYVSFNGDELLVDFSYQQMDANENIIKAYEEQVNAYNDYLSKRKSNDKELKAMNEERDQLEKDYLKKYTDAQKDVIDILKDQAAEEVKTQKDKYDALKEADSDYLDALQDAIEKQRKLREQENAEENLAQKEKRLSLMQRDTSGANAKEVKQLEQEVEKDRESLLDNKIDNIVDDMRELYEKQAEARDAEIEYMEAVTENAQYFNEWARSIVESWESAEDMTTWFLNNDKNAEDLTIEQQELYIADLKEKWTDIVIWQGLQLTDVKANLENIDNQMSDILTNFSEDATSQAEEISAIAHKAAQDEIDEADRAYKAAVKTRQDTLNDIEELHKKIAEAEEVAQLKYGEAMKSMEVASKEAMKNTSVYAVKVLADFLGVDLRDETATKAFAEKQGLVNTNGQYSQSLIDAVWQSGGDASKYKGTQTYGVYLLPKAGSGGQPSLVESYGTREAAEQAAKKYENAKVMEEVNSGRYGDVSNYIPSNSPTFSTTAVDKDIIAQKTSATPPKTGNYMILTMEDGTPRYTLNDRGTTFDWINVKGVKSVKWSNSGVAAQWSRYANGGLVKHTGPAWVDGTPSHPESFLSAEDTQRILDAAEFFAMSPLLNSSMASNDVSSSVGDTSVEININVENIADDYDVDRLIKRVENDINETARPTGTPVILNKRV